MPQIQYPAYTSPPAFTAPTIPQLGWWGSRPDVVRHHARGRWDVSRLQTASQTTGANVFAIEQWTVISSTKDIGHTYLPTNPQQFINRRDYRGKGGGYLNAPWSFWGFDLENLPLPKPMVATAFYPDKLNYRRDHPWWPSGDVPLQPPAAVVALDWLGYEDAQIPRLKWRVGGPSVFRSDALEQADAVLQWSVEAPDTTTRAKLPTAQIPATFRGELVENRAAVLQWSVTAPSSTSRRALTTPNLTAQFRPETVETAPATLLWSVVAPDTTARAKLTTAQIPSLARGEFVENRAAVLQWSVQAPSTTRQRSLTTGELPSLSLQPPPIAVDLRVWAFGPSTTRRLSLSVADVPAAFWNSLQFAIVVPTFVRPIYPDRTRRAIREAVWMPSEMIDAAAVIGKGFERRYDDQTGRVGSRSAVSRISQL
jgi:hypothetical protein